MRISQDLLQRLRSGDSIACELPCAEAGMRAFVEILGRTIPSASMFEPRVRVSGFEIRYLKHHERYTIGDYGNDYLWALDDESTVIRRSFVESEEQFAAALAPWDIAGVDWRG